jgi:hypothetical protein
MRQLRAFIFIVLIASCFRVEAETYLQEYCGYSITLPEGWKQVIDEKDLDISTWSNTSGLSRYHAQPGKQPGLGEWIYMKDPGVYLVVLMMKREPECGFSLYVDHILRSYLDDGFNVVTKGSGKVQERQWKWWQMTLSEGGDLYLSCIGNKEYFYVITFTTAYVSADLKKQFEDIIQTIKFNS